MSYLKWSEQTIKDFSDENINSLYNQGYVFTRTGKGDLYQTRSLRIDLNKFELSSENRRILRKTEDIKLEALSLPYASYDWKIGKLGKDFYDTKFGDHTFSANKIKELMTDKEKSNFNLLLTFSTVIPTTKEESLAQSPVGYAICYQNLEILHYCYPFYQLPINKEQETMVNIGIGMMTKAIAWAKEQNKKYFYLGSFQRPADTYKLQFTGLEWWDQNTWNADVAFLKQQLNLC